MPEDNSPARLEWNEANLEQVLTDLYQEIETDDGLRQRLTTDPFEVLSRRIAIPENYRSGIFVAEKGQEIMALYLPARDAASREALPEGTLEAVPQPNFQYLCTTVIPW